MLESSRAVLSRLGHLPSPSLALVCRVAKGAIEGSQRAARHTAGAEQDCSLPRAPGEGARTLFHM